MHGDDGEHGRIPLPQHPPLKPQVVKLTPRQHAARITRLAHSRLDERAEISTAAQLVLEPQSTIRTEVAGPLRVDLTFEVERVPLVGEVSGDEEEDEGDPEEEGVYGQKGAVVHHEPGPAESGCEYPHAGGEG